MSDIGDEFRRRMVQEGIDLTAKPEVGIDPGVEARLKRLEAAVFPSAGVACEIRDCGRPATEMVVGESGDLNLCSFHGGATEGSPRPSHNRAASTTQAGASVVSSPDVGEDNTVEGIGWYISDTHARRAIGYLTGSVPELHGIKVPLLAKAWGEALAQTVDGRERSPIGPEVAAPSAGVAQPRCVCGEKDHPCVDERGVLHRPDGPCYQYASPVSQGDAE